MKIKIFLIIILNVIFSQDVGNNNIEKKQDFLEEIDSQINELENKLEEQIKNQEGADNQLNIIIEKINIEKENLIENKNQEKYQSELLKQANHIIDSLKNNVLNLENEKYKATLLIKEINKKNNIATKQILNLNDSLINVENGINQTLDTLKKVKTTIKNIIQETLSVNAPSDLEFILESDTWDNFILNSVIYDILIDNKKNNIDELLNLEKNMREQYSKNLIMQNNLIQNKKELKQKLEDYKYSEIRLNNNLIEIEILVLEKELMYDKIISEYEKINTEVTNTQNIINSLINEKNKIYKIQKNIDVETKRIELALNAKKEARFKIEKEITKLLTQSSKYKGSNINRFKNKLPWPIMGDLITKFGKNISSKGIAFNYNFIEFVGNEILYLTKEINPKKPDKDLVKKFQKRTMNLKDGDTGYGVFGPQTTKTWKKYNEIRISDKQKMPIIAIHDGIIEEMKFLDPITGVLVIIRHNDESFSAYSGHIDLIVSEGEIVNKEQKIGLIKQENILSFQLWIDTKIVNPQNWLIKK